MSANPFAALRSEVVDPDAAARRDHGGLPAARAGMRAAAHRAAALAPDEARRGSRRSRAASSTRLRGKTRSSGVEGLIHEYSLSSQEGVALMCLAEALLRIPDAATRDALIRDKLSPGDWRAHVGTQPVAVRQRRDLGPRPDRPAGRDQQRADAERRADPPHRAQRRADHPQGRRRRHAPDGRAVRHRPHDRGGDQREPRARSARLHLLLRHAGRSGDDRRGRGALSRRI